MRLADLEAVTVDGFGTLVELEDPVQRLAEALEARGIHRPLPEVATAFEAEAAYYRPRSHLARDAERLRQLRHDCVRVFLEVLTAPVEPGDFVGDFLSALVLRPVDDVERALLTLRENGLRLAVVSNWDCSLPERLAEVGLSQRFDAVVSSAEAGAPKPDPRPFLIALERLGTRPERALHVGDEDADVRGADAAGMRFAPAPLSDVVAALA